MNKFYSSFSVRVIIRQKLNYTKLLLFTEYFLVAISYMEELGRSCYIPRPLPFSQLNDRGIRPASVTS
jgi:hypothetical protein